jgi:hypothetical protein
MGRQTGGHDEANTVIIETGLCGRDKIRLNEVE